MPSRRSNPMGRHVGAALATVVTVVALLPMPGVADHVQQTSSGEPITFDHRGGNEWWVEVRVTVQDVHAVWARSENGDWNRLDLRSWGNWAASFHVPPGQRVQFQAALSGSSFDIWRQNSCYFTHPAGQEQCDPGSTDAFEASFGSPTGNAWWQEVRVDANGPVSRVYAALDTVHGFDYKPLTLRSWGAWAGSYYAPQGTTVMFVAANAAGADESGCYRWTRVEPIECPPRHSRPPPAGWMTRFDHKTGNEWWVEALAGPVQPTRMAAQDEGGSWVELSWRSWGAWAGSFHVEPGNRVHFRALVDDDWWESCWFTHPQGLSPEGSQICGNTFIGDWTGP